jgi:hypothetical protein
LSIDAAPWWTVWLKRKSVLALENPLARRLLPVFTSSTTGISLDSACCQPRCSDDRRGDALGALHAAVARHVEERIGRKLPEIPDLAATAAILFTSAWSL